MKAQNHFYKYNISWMLYVVRRHVRSLIDYSINWMLYILDRHDPWFGHITVIYLKNSYNQTKLYLDC